METTNPPNSAGFNKKPDRKFKRPTRRRKYNRLKNAHTNKSFEYWLVGSFFLMCAAELFVPLFHQRIGAIPAIEK